MSYSDRKKQHFARIIAQKEQSHSGTKNKFVQVAEPSNLVVLTSRPRSKEGQSAGRLYMTHPPRLDLGKLRKPQR